MKCLLKRIAFLLPLILCAGPFAADSTSVVKVGVTIRSRIETNDYTATLGMNNWYAPEPGSSYYRQRTGLMLRITPLPRYELGVRLTNEFRRYFVPTGYGFSSDEVVMDQFYIKGDSIAGTPFSAIIGRQNIMLGEGFLIADGSPLDGSRTAYFNAVNLGWQFSPTSSLRVILYNQQKVDDILPIIDNNHRGLIEGDEKGAIIYLTTSIDRLTLEPYLIQIERNRSRTFPHAGIGCAGLRLRAQITPQFTATSELAAQFGDWGEVDQKGLGGYGYFDYKTNLPTYYPSTFTLGGVYLSGDDRNTELHEGFDPLYGRWPKWSESYAYTLATETALAYWSNFASLFVKTSASLGSDLTAGLEYHHLMSVTKPPQRYEPYDWVFLEADGTDRGYLLVLRLNYQLKPRLSGHIVYEQFDPESFYSRYAQDFSWMRMEMMLTF
jgi:hypothetical protein